jgi:uncharacterized protein
MKAASVPFHIMAKPIGPICNLDCRYCFYLEKDRLYPARESWPMSGEVLRSYIRQYIESQDRPVVSFAWQGGEPTLLGVEFFRQAVSIQREFAQGKRIENSLQTNGVLLNDEWGLFLREEGFLVGLSIDGPRELHDRYRVNQGGGSTFNAVLRGLEVLQRHQVEFNTLTVVQNHNSHYPLEVYRFLKQAGSQYLQLIPIVERETLAALPGGLTLVPPDSPGNAKVTPWSVEPRQYGKFLMAVFDEWIRRDVGSTFVQLFDVALQAWCGFEPGVCVFAKTCGRTLALEHNGDLYSCDHYVYPENRLGNIMESPLSSLVHSPPQIKFGLDKLDALPRYCRQCEVRFACNGECPKHRFLQTPAGEPGLNYLCAGYQAFFRHIDPYMRFMAEELRGERPPANVMAWVHRSESGVHPKKTPDRNDPCPCGSGRKFKKCCG